MPHLLAMYLANGEYHLNPDISLLDLAQEFGTPLYIYDTSVMQKQYERLATSLQVPRKKICYACKANSNLQVLRFFQHLGAGLDCVSIQEVALGLRAGFAPDDILFTPNCVALEEYDQARAWGVQDQY